MKEEILEIINQLDLKHKHQGLHEEDFCSARSEVIGLFNKFKKMNNNNNNNGFHNEVVSLMGGPATKHYSKINNIYYDSRIASPETLSSILNLLKK